MTVWWWAGKFMYLPRYTLEMPSLGYPLTPRGPFGNVKTEAEARTTALLISMITR
jgi:hypothetical protein